MSAAGVTVAIPVRDGGELLARTLAALALQTVEHELLVCDSGSTDGSLALARSHDARVIEIPPREFSHGGTRNLLLAEAVGEHVALLTQDSEPADERWLERLLEGFALARDVGIVYGPYIPRPRASPAVRWELERWFSSLSPDGRPRVERLREDERALPAVALIGARGFFTDANACVSRAAWSEAPFRDVPYAEDRLLAIDMLRAGYAKAFVPGAAVLHSHDYTARRATAPLLSTSGAACARCMAGVSPPRPCTSPVSCGERWARRGARRCARGCPRPAAARRSPRSAVTMFCASPARCSARARTGSQPACAGGCRWRGGPAFSPWISTATQLNPPTRPPRS